MSITRRDFLLLIGGSTSALALSYVTGCDNKITNAEIPFSFQSIKGPIPLATAGLTPEQQQAEYSTYEVVDDLVLPKGFQYQVIAAWGDVVGDSRFGYNNDYLSFLPTAENEGYLSVNFEYVSTIPWIQTYEQVIGKSLPFESVKTALKAQSSGKIEINAYALPDSDPIKAQIREICTEALLDQGLGVISIRQGNNGQWERNNSVADRRISGISGLEDGRYLQATGPAVAVFRKQQGQGYIDQLGDRIIGTFANCAGGTTPWGTVLSAEENFQIQVTEAVYADGTSFDPSQRPFALGDEELYGQGNVFGLAGNKYGWIVEIDPANPKDYGTKHTWLGRYRHEAVGVRVEKGKPIAFYSGCDRRGGHIYKFISRDRVNNPKDKANSQLLQQGMLYAAKFNADGTGHWLPLNADTPINPDIPQIIAGNVIRLPIGPKLQSSAAINDGYLLVKKDEEITQFKQIYQQLGELYIGTPEEKQGAILIDAHYAANAVGATCTARPEDTVIAANGDLYIAFTSGFPDQQGGADVRIFKSPTGETPYEYGWLMRLSEDHNDLSAHTFRWQILATGGEPAAGGMGFANPDNLLLDPQDNLWMVTDISTNKLNNSIKTRTNDQGKAVSLSGLFGNNAIWFLPTHGEDVGKAFLFGMGPMECETTGPCFTPDHKTIFLSIQHPGEFHGIRKDQASETREFVITNTLGEEFLQTRQVPIGSNWPHKTPNSPPKPAVVAVSKV
ncbi:MULTISPECIES: PhoX family protein [unclassified Anabaena]|uniref:PhoX family protein n=1 Tax=unclassified Anabaena TaxID=2619674 RepID=UPI0039C630A1